MATNINAQYILKAPTLGTNNTLLDLRLKAGTLSLSGQTAVITGTAAVDYVYASVGTSVDFTASGVGADVLYLDGAAAQYSVATTSNIVTLTRGTSIYKLDKATTASVAFTDGGFTALDLSALSGVLSSASAGFNPALNSMVAVNGGDAGSAETVSLQTAGVVTATGLMGKLTISGSSGVDNVYIRAGANVDATSLGGSTDIVWFTGKWADYTKTTVGSNVLKFTRTSPINGNDEVVTVVAGANVLNDKLMFADGYVFSKDAWVNKTATDLVAAGGKLSTLPGEFTDAALLGGLTVQPTLTISADTNLTTDYITSTAAQAISGTYTGVLEDGDKIQIAVVAPGSALVTWQDATVTPTAGGGGTFTLAGQTLLEGANTIKVAVLSASGVSLAADRLHAVSITNGGTVILDTTTPSGTVGFFVPADGYVNSSEIGTLTGVPVKVSLVDVGVTNKAAVAGDTIQLQVNDGTNPTATAGTPYTITAADVLNGYATVTVPKASLQTLAVPASHDGTYAVTAVFTDKAGNTSTSVAASIVVDTAGPASTFTVSAVAADGTTALSATAKDAYLNALETDIIFDVVPDAANGGWKAGDYVQLFNTDTNATVGTADSGSGYHKITAADITAGHIYLTVPKTDIAGATPVDGTYKLSVKTYDDAGNIKDTKLVSAAGTGSDAIVVDSKGIDASLAIATVAVAGSGAPSTAPGAVQSTDEFLAADEHTVVLKIDSTNFATNTALKVGDVITLQVLDTTPGPTFNKYIDLVKDKAGTPSTYTYTVTKDDIAAGDGSPTATGNAAYISVNKADLATGATSTVQAKLVDLAGNTAVSTNKLSITVQGDIILSMDSSATNLEVTSQIVLSSTQALSTAAHKLITFTNTADAGFTGETNVNTFSVYADDSRYVTISGTKIIIKPPFDFDFANNYNVTVEAGAFLTAPVVASAIPALGTKAVITGDNLNFTTVSLGTDVLSAVQGQVMNATTGAVETTGAKKWFSVDQSGSMAEQTFNLAGNDYAMVFKDLSTAGYNPTLNDGVGAADFNVTVNGFGANDLIYADDQNNNKAKLNDLANTQIWDDFALPNQQILEFDNDGSTSFWGARFTINGDGASLSRADVLSRINIANTKMLTTTISAIERVDSTGAVVASNLLGAGVTDSQPLLVKVSAPNSASAVGFKTGDKVQLVYIDGTGTVQNLGTAYTVTPTDATNGNVTVSVSRTVLNGLPEKDGYFSNSVFAQVTNDNGAGAISFSKLLGGDDGIYFDAIAPTPTLVVNSGEDNFITGTETGVNLVVKAADIAVGDTLVLKLGSTQIGTSVTVTALTASNDVVFNVPKASLALGANTLTVISTDAAGNVGTSPITITRNEYVSYNGTVGLGPVLSTNDLQVTAYDKAGTVLGTASVSSTGTYALDIDKSYTGAITLRVANKTTSTATADYRDEAAGATKDIGATGSIAAVVVADGTSQTVNVTALTDLVARQLSVNNVVTTTATINAQINAYNLKLAQLLGVSTTEGITSILPTFVMDSAGTATLSVAGKYGQLLAQISDQAVVKATTMDAVQTQLANAITWTWNAGTSTATATVSGDIAKQVVLFTQVAQAAALANGSDAGAYLSATDLSTYGITGVSGLSAARKADLMARIVNSADDGSAFDTLTEVQALADKVVALAKIQDYATLSTNPAPTVADYTTAGITGVVAGNLVAVNAKLVGSAAVNAANVPDDGIISTVVSVGVAAQTTALAKIVAYATLNTNPAPTLTDYALAGVTGVNADNLVAINTKVDAKVAADVNTLTLAQGVVDTAITAYNSAVALIKAYIRDGVANPAPVLSTFADAGLTTIDTANELDSAKYYLDTVMANADADLSGAAILDKLTAQQTALAKINAYAVSNASVLGAPTVADYVAAGIPSANSTNLQQLNTSVDGVAAIAKASDLATLLAPLFAGIPSLTSIVREGSSVVNGTFQSDAYLNAAELAAGKTAQFTVTFDRAVTGINAANFNLTDANGLAVTGATPTMAVATADGGVGKLWTVTVSALTGLSSSSLRLNLANGTGLVDAGSGKPLSSTTFTGGQAYTVDTTNTIAIAPATGEDSTLSINESSVNLYVSPATLAAGDTLKLLKADGSQVGSTVTVTTAQLSTGVTFNVAKTSLGNGANVLTVQSTDVAGNVATGNTTINVSEYLQVSGILGLPSKVLATNDLAVTAYDTSGNVLGTGTINAATNTYTLQMLKATTGLVKLKLTSNSTGKDFWDEAANASTDLGSMAISATISADGVNAKTANITLLTDLASRVIGTLTTPTAAQITAANTAITKLLLNSASTTEITAFVPDFAIDTAGASTATTATLYGQLLAQLSQQAKEKGKALDVVLEDLAAGIAYNTGTSTATLNNAFAKEVFLLAKVQMAAALTTGTLVNSSILTVQNLIDGGITGLNTINTATGSNPARQADLLARIVATADSGGAVDTLAEVQALANKVVALAKIQDYATLDSNPAPTVADYTAAALAGITVTADNLTAVNLRVKNSDAVNTSTDDLVATVVGNGITAYTAAVAKIAAYASLNTNAAPMVADYVDAGVTSVTDANLAAVNAKVDAAAQTAADTTAEIQGLANAGVVAYADAITTLKNYIANGSAATVPTATTFRDAGLPTIDSTAEVANANYYLDSIMADADNTLAASVILDKLTAQQTAIAKIDAYATATNSALGAPMAADYVAAGITGANVGNTAALNTIVDGNPGGTAPTNTIAGLKTAVSALFAAVPSITSINRVGTSVVNGAFQTDSIINEAELSGTVNFTVTFDRTVTGLSAANFRLVDGAGIAAAGVASPTYNITTTDNLNFNVAVSGISALTSTQIRLDFIKNDGITDIVSGQAPLTTTFTTGQSYTIDKTYNTTVVAATGQDLTLDPSETAANIFVDASKLQAGDTLTLKLTGGATLATATVSAADITAGGVTLSVLKTALTSPAPGAATDYSNAITLTHTDTAGNVSAATSAIVVARTVTVSGTIGLGPVVTGTDLLVTAYDTAGKVMGTSTVDGTTGVYTMNVIRTYTGPLLLKVTSAGNLADYRDEATNTNTDLGTGSISAVITADGSNKTAHITALTDIAARLLTVSGGMIASDTTTAKVDSANLLVTKQFINSASTLAVTAIEPDFTVTAAGAVDTTATVYGQVLAQLSKQMQTSGAGLAYTQALVANSINFAFNSGTPASSTMTLGQAAKDTVFLAKVGQAAALSSTALVSSIITEADLTAAGITNFSTLSATRQTDVITRIVNGANDGAATDTLAEVQALVNKVKAIGMIQDYKTAAGAAPTVGVYADAGIAGVNVDNLSAVNAAVMATVADITANPDTVIAAAAVTGGGTQSTAFAVITAYANLNTNPAPTVQNYSDAGITGVTAANLAAVNARVDAKALVDVNTLTKAQAVVDAGIVANTDAITLIQNYLADSTKTVPVLTDYRDANLAAITTTTQVDNANYLLSKVLSGQTFTTAQLSTKLGDQITAINLINAYAANNTNPAPTFADFNKAGFSQVDATSVAEINARVDVNGSCNSTAAILSLLQVIDLDSATLGFQLATTVSAGGGTAQNLFSTVNKTYLDGIKSIKVVASGSVDATNDSFVFATATGVVTKGINATALTGSGVTINTVTGIDWSYNSAKELVFKKTDGSSFTAAQAQLIEQALQFNTVASASTTQGNRVFTLSHTDTSGTVSFGASSTVAVDTTVSGVDLLAAAGMDTATSGYVTALTAVTNNVIITKGNITASTDTDLAKVSVVVGGAALDTSGDSLVLDTKQALNANFKATNVTIGTVAGLDYSYTASTKTLLISANSGAVITGTDMQKIINGLAFNTSSAVQGNRTFAISYIDKLGNQGVASTATLTVDTIMAKPVVTLATDNGVSMTDNKTTDGSLNITGIAADTTWKYSLDGGTTFTNGVGSTIASASLGAAGAKTVLVRATDTAGNIADTTVSFTLASAITKTATLSNLGDNVSTNGSVTTSITVVNTSTDDTTPTLTGTLSAALTGSEVLAVYDGTTKLGNATTSTTTWNYTTPVLSSGKHSFTLRVEDPTTGVAGNFTSAFNTNVYSALNMDALDNVGASQISGIGEARYVMLRRDASTVDFNFAELQVMSNGVNVALNKTLAANNTAGFLDALDGNTSTFYAPTANPLNANAWVQVDLGAVYQIDSIVITPRSGLEPRMNSTNIYYSIDNMAAGAAATTAISPPTSTAVYLGTTASSTPVAAQTFTPSSANTLSDDNTPTFRGTLPTPLGTGEELAIYKTIGGVTSKMGTASVTDLTWTYTPAALVDGAYSFKAMVQPTGDTTGTAGKVVSTNTAFTINTAAISKTATISGIADNVATNGSTTTTVATGLSTDDTTPTLSGTVSAALTAGTEVLAIYDGATKLGNAVTSGTTWTFTPAAALAVGTHSFSARVENVTSGAQGTASTAYTANIDNTLVMSIKDDLNLVVDPISTTSAFATSSAIQTTTAQTFATGTSIKVIQDLNLSLLKMNLAGIGVPSAFTLLSTSDVWSVMPSSAVYTGNTDVTFWATCIDDGGYMGIQVKITTNASGNLSMALLQAKQTYSSTGPADFVAGLGTTYTLATTTAQSGAVGVSAISLEIPPMTDDNTPTFSGTLDAPLGTGEELAIYSFTMAGVATKLGAATVTGSTWAFTPGTAIANGTYEFKAMVQANTITNASAGKVVSAGQKFTVASVPSQTTTITAVTDSVATNASTTGALTTGTSTDDAVLVVTGTISAALTTPIQRVVVYDGSTLLGNATVTGTNWTYTTPTLAAGSHSLTAQVIDDRTSGLGAAPTARVVNVMPTTPTFTMTDNVGGTTGTLASGATTDDNTPTLSGSLGTAMASGEELAIYKTVGGVTTKAGVATLGANNLDWTFTPATALADGAYTFKAMVQTAGDTSGTAGRVVSASSTLTIGTLAPTKTASLAFINDDVSTNGSNTGTVSTGGSTDDTTPTLSGGVSATLAGEVVAIYDGATKLGNATVTGTTWTYTPTALAAGAHSFTALVENATSGAQGTASTPYTANVYSSMSLDPIQPATTNARYIMLRRSAAASYFAMSEVQVMCNGVNVALNKTFTVGAQGTSGSQNQLLDGSKTTWYAASGVNGNAWVQIDLGAAYDINSIIVIPLSGGEARMNGTSIFTSVSDMSAGAATVTTPTSAPTASAKLFATTPTSTPATDLPFSLETFTGTLPTALGSGEEVAVYKTTGGVTTFVGVATMTGNNWSLTSAIPNGSYTFKAVVQTAGNTAGTAGKAVSASVSFVVDGSAPTQTATISSIADNVTTNGSTTTAVSTGFTTDDTTPTLSGTVSAALTGGQVLAVYDGATKLGNAVMSTTTWTFAPATALALGAHSFTARVENPANSGSGAASTAYIANIQNMSMLTVTDDVGLATGSAGFFAPVTTGFIGTSDVAVSDIRGSVASVIDPTRLTLTTTGTVIMSGTLAVQAATVKYTGANQVTFWATINDTGSVTTKGVKMSISSDASGNISAKVLAVKEAPGGAYNLAYDFENGGSNLNIATGSGQSGAAIGAMTVAPKASITTEDNHPTLSGALTTTLGVGEELAVYQTIGGITTKAGVATISGTGANTTWSFTPSVALADGTYTFKAMVQVAGDASGTAGKVVSSSATLTVAAGALPTQTVIITSIADDVSTNGSITGTVLAGATTDDTTPTLSGTLSAVLLAGEQLAVYDGATKLGNATVTTTSWTFTPTTPLAGGAHSFTAQVEKTATLAHGAASAAYVADIHSSLAMAAIDNVGALQGNQPSGSPSDDLRPTLSGSLAVAMDSTEELAIYQTLAGVTTKMGAATITGGTNWSFTPTADLPVGTYTFKAMVQPTGDTTGLAGKVVSASTTLTLGTQDLAFSNILNTDPSSGLAVKALAVAAGMTLDMQTNAHTEIAVLNLGAGSSAKIDLADLMQNTAGLFTSTNFTGLTGFAGMKQLVVNGSAGSSVLVDTPVLSSTWTKSATTATNSGHTYDVYNNSNGQAQLLIDQLVQRTGAVI
jgi:hypothetical protein